jgi:hypothetical protein
VRGESRGCAESGRVPVSGTNLPSTLTQISTLDVLELSYVTLYARGENWRQW